MYSKNWPNIHEFKDFVSRVIVSCTSVLFYSLQIHAAKHREEMTVLRKSLDEILDFVKEGKELKLHLKDLEHMERRFTVKEKGKKPLQEVREQIQSLPQLTAVKKKISKGTVARCH